MNAEVITSIRGKEILLVNNHKFRQCKFLKSGELFWRCLKSNCKAKVFTIGKDYEITRSDYNHTHDAMDERVIKKLLLNTVCRKVVLENKTNPVLSITKKIPSDNIPNSLSSIRRSKYTIKKKVHSNEDDDVTECYGIDSENLLVRLKNEAKIESHESPHLSPNADNNFMDQNDDSENLMHIDCSVKVEETSDSDSLMALSFNLKKPDEEHYDTFESPNRDVVESNSQNSDKLKIYYLNKLLEEKDAVIRNLQKTITVLMDFNDVLRNRT